MTSAEIRTLLQLKGWSQADLAHELGVTEAAVSYWMSGDRSPTSATAKTLRKLLEEAEREAKEKNRPRAAVPE